TGASTGFQNGTGSINQAGTLTIQAADINGGTAVSVTVAASDVVSTVVANINAAVGYTIASVASGAAKPPDAGPNAVPRGGTAAVVTAAGFTTTTSSAAVGAVESVDQIAAAINANTSLSGKVKASNNAGQLQITNLSTSALTVTGVGASGKVDGSTSTTSV